ncbi:hypothetical protein KKH39_01525 [Patescibacteria group bacterium]|nr:hypothetical protein [Patescibacteria group bacterium]
MIRKNEYLELPIFDVLTNFGFQHFKKHYYFNTNAIFWSLSRLFLYYDRIISETNKNEPNHYNIAADLESFIIRQRILLNDIAYIIWQTLPKNTRNLKTPTGPAHPQDQEMSIHDLYKSLEKKPTIDIALKKILDKNKKWIFKLKEQREKIIHYKSQIVIFGTKPLSFAMINSNGPEKTYIDERGRKKVETLQIINFINNQTKYLLKFINTDIKNWLIEYISNNNIKYDHVLDGQQLHCTGIATYKKINNL